MSPIQRNNSGMPCVQYGTVQDSITADTTPTLHYYEAAMAPINARGELTHATTNSLISGPLSPGTPLPKLQPLKLLGWTMPAAYQVMEPNPSVVMQTTDKRN